MSRILIDPVACDAYGFCAELLPEAITLDEWGYPIVDGVPLPSDLVDAARRAAATARAEPSPCRSPRPPAEVSPRGGGDPPCMHAPGGGRRHNGVVTPAEVRIRHATEADIRSLVELIVLGALPGVARDEDPDDTAPYGVALRQIEAAGGMVLVAETGRTVVGVCQLIVFRHLQHRGGLCAEIESVHVHPEHRGAGIGSALVRAATERARALGCYRVQLTSNAARTEAHRFYERLGFLPSHVGFKFPLDHGLDRGAVTM